MSDFRFQQRDFLGILSDMKSYFKDRLGENWTDSTEADPAVALMENFAYTVKNLHYYVDQQKRESDVVTAVRPRNVYWKAVRDGYVPHGYRPASGEISLKFIENTAAGVTIPKHALFQTDFAENNLLVTTLEDQVLSEEPIDITKQDTYLLNVVQGQFKTITKTRQDITQNGYIKLPTEKVSTDLGMVEVVYQRTSDEVITFTQSTDVYTDYREGYYFSVHPLFLRNETVSMVQFPYNWTDLFDTDGNITITYLETEGDKGHIAKSSYNETTETWTGGVSLVNQNLYDMSDPPATINDLIGSIYNVHPITGGTATESVSSIKINTKSSIRDLKTLVTLQDYEDFVRIETATNVSAVDLSIDAEIPPRCIYIYLEMNPDSWIGYEEFTPPGDMNEKMEYIYSYCGLNQDESDNMVWNDGEDDMPHSYNEFWSPMYNGVVEKTNNRRGRRDLVVFLKPNYNDYEITANIWLKVSGDDPETIFQQIVADLKEELSTIPQIGKNHYQSQIIAALQKANSRISNVELLTPETDIISNEFEIPRFTIPVNGIRFKFLDGSEDVVLPADQVVG